MPRAELFTVVSAADCYNRRDHLAAFDGRAEVADGLRHQVGLYVPRGRAVEALGALMRQTRRPVCMDTSGVSLYDWVAGGTPVTVLVVDGTIVGVWREVFKRASERERFWQQVESLTTMH